MMPWVSNAIVKGLDSGHITLTCRNHLDLAWSTKNLGWIGARSIFFFGWRGVVGGDPCSHRMVNAEDALAIECACPGDDLLIVLPDGTLLCQDGQTPWVPKQ